MLLFLQTKEEEVVAPQVEARQGIRVDTVVEEEEKRRRRLSSNNSSAPKRRNKLRTGSAFICCTSLQKNGSS